MTDTRGTMLPEDHVASAVEYGWCAAAHGWRRGRLLGLLIRLMRPGSLSITCQRRGRRRRMMGGSEASVCGNHLAALHVLRNPPPPRAHALRPHCRAAHPLFRVGLLLQAHKVLRGQLEKVIRGIKFHWSAAQQRSTAREHSNVAL